MEPEWAQRVVDAADVRPGELILDLCAGTGALTRPLARAGARVLAVELHPGRADRLRRRVGDLDVRVVEHDALQVPLPRRPFRVVANPAYSLSTPLLRRLLAPGVALVSAQLVVQRALARRYVEGRGHDRGRWRYSYDARIQMNLPRRAFSPPPTVDSCVLTLWRR